MRPSRLLHFCGPRKDLVDLRGFERLDVEQVFHYEVSVYPQWHAAVNKVEAVPGARDRLSTGLSGGEAAFTRGLRKDAAQDFHRFVALGGSDIQRWE